MHSKRNHTRTMGGGTDSVAEMIVEQEKKIRKCSKCNEDAAFMYDMKPELREKIKKIPHPFDQLLTKLWLCPVHEKDFQTKMSRIVKDMYVRLVL